MNKLIKIYEEVLRECDGCQYFDVSSIYKYVEFDKPLYALVYKRRMGKLLYVTPKEYIYKIAMGFGGLSYNDTLQAYNDKLGDKYAKAMKNGNKFPIGYYTLGSGMQEGRHRAMAAMKLGVNKIPIIEFSNINRDKFIEYIKSFRGKSFEDLKQVFINNGAKEITMLGYNDLKRFIEYNSEELESIEINERKDLNNTLNKIDETILNERLIDADSDVNYLYNRFFKDTFDEIADTGIINNNTFIHRVTDTSKLQSAIAIKANKLNPCLITINALRGNYYSPLNNVISISVNKNAVNFIINNGGSIKNSSDTLNDEDAYRLKREFIDSTIKGSIHHELSHWIDDTLHNNYIKNRLDTAEENGSSLTKKSLPIDAHEMEINAQIHNIKQLKNKYDKEWDSLSFDDMIRYSPALSMIYKELVGEIKNKWIKKIKKRMYREGLFGKNMR